MTMHDLAELEQRLAQGPDPCASDAPAHTSGLKRKRLPHAECERLVVHLLSGHTRTQRLLAGIVALSAILPMRPCEWATASVVRGSLRIVCAKCTNGRGIARMRLVELDETLAKAASNTVRAFRKQLSEAGSLRRFHARLSKALTRACVEAKIAPICLYTLRHQALATAKRFFPAEVVAALAGHASVVTATRVYAKRRGGWSVKPSISVSPRSEF
jgi:integrase